MTTAESFARAIAENAPDGTDAYGDPCCHWCGESLKFNYGPRDDYRSRCVHSNGCAWVELRRSFGLALPVTFPGGERHRAVGDVDDE